MAMSVRTVSIVLTAIALRIYLSVAGVTELSATNAGVNTIETVFKLVHLLERRSERRR